MGLICSASASLKCSNQATSLKHYLIYGKKVLLNANHWKQELTLTFGVGVGEEAVPRNFAAQRQRQEVVPGFDVDDAVEILLRGRTQDPCRTKNGEKSLYDSLYFSV